jgi:transcriptional regulator with PAS, ATPase and Fis domain
MLLYGQKHQTKTKMKHLSIDFEAEIEQIQNLIDEGISRKAEEKAQNLLKLKPRDVNILAKLRLILSKSWELQARYKEGLGLLQIYQNEEIRLGLDEQLDLEIQNQIALFHIYLSDSPKAVSQLKKILDEAIEIEAGNEIIGLINGSLARAYRALGQTSISRDFADKALNCYRAEGNWRGMTQAYSSLANIAMFEGKYEESIEYSRQILSIIGDRPENFWLARAYVDMAANFYYLRRPIDGIACLEKSIGYFEQTEHLHNALAAYNNLGIHLTTIGEWERAETALMKALKISIEINHTSRAMIQDSLGELYVLKEDFSNAKKYLQNAVSISRENNRKWYLMVVLRTFGNFQIATGDLAKAYKIYQECLSLAEEMRDEGNKRIVHLKIAEIYLREQKFAEFEAEIEKVELTNETHEQDLLATGLAQFLNGKFAVAQNDLPLAEYHFNRSLSLYETLHEFYYSSLCHLELGTVLAKSNPQSAIKNLNIAVANFSKLQVRRLLEQAEKQLAEIKPAAVSTKQSATNIGLLTMRLTEAATSRELLFREFLAVLRQESRAKKIIIARKNKDKNLVASQFSGFTPAETQEILRNLQQAQVVNKENAFIESKKLNLTKLFDSFLLVYPRNAARLSDGSSLKPLLKVVELGLEVCNLRENGASPKNVYEINMNESDNLLSGFIHSSPAMEVLFDEMYKIRKSDVTVLVTGESGTGKELVSQAIHALSTRQDRIFIPFNCTAVPKELVEGHLFGYKKGAFTGAVNDHEGVIRSAQGGTLFLDEIGDLPLDVQPKLLRFLQEGEIQPLGEKKPIKVDVRVIAATNVALEEQVAEGKFREDLYYRLNVIRLRVPPLRERRSEIPHIVNLHVKKYSERFNKRNISITPQAIDLLMVCDWEGNVRQLCNELQRIVARADDNEIITPEHLSPELKRSSIPMPSLMTANSLSSSSLQLQTENAKLDDIVSNVESSVILEVLKRHKGNISRVAKELGISRRGLYMKLEKYGLYKVNKNPYYYQ